MPATKSAQAPAFETVRSWLREIRNEKAAAAGDSNEKTTTTHPSKSVDNGTMKPNEGARSRENESDVEKMVPANVDKAKDNPSGKTVDNQYQIGTRKSEVGGDSSTEDNYEDRPKETEKTKTTLTQVSAREGEKYSFSPGDFDKVLTTCKAAGDLANEIMAAIAIKEHAVSAQTAPASAPGTPNPVAAAGSKEAGTPSLDQILGFQTKEAADKAAEAVISARIAYASESAIKVANYLHQVMNEEQKRAQQSQPNLNIKLPLLKKRADAPDGDPGAPPPPGGPPMDPAMAGGPGGPPPGLDGPPPGGDAGGPPPDAGGAGGMGGDPQHALQELAMALMEMGITPEQLAQMAQAMAAGGAGGPGGPPPDAGGAGGPPEGSGGMPPDAGGAGGPPPPDVGKVASDIAHAVYDFKASGKFRFTEAKSGSQERQLRNEYKKYISEVVAIGRQR